MFNPSPTTTIAIPFRQGPASKLGAIMNDDYFGKVPAKRLKIAASYDSDNQLLTLVQ
ncbi:MAG: hypothetical protein P8N76_26295 [Pirellulaceae bacterium]|nr:hypothetical protein [Pirellulaceae bacterium]